MNGVTSTAPARTEVATSTWPLGLPARLAAAALSALLATGTLLLVENPVRFAAPLRRSPRRSLLLGGGLTTVGVCALAPMQGVTVYFVIALPPS